MNKENELLYSDKHYLVTPKDVDFEHLVVIEFQADPDYITHIKNYLEERFYEVRTADSLTRLATRHELLRKSRHSTAQTGTSVQLDNYNIEEVMAGDKPLTSDTYISYDKSVLMLPQVESFINLIKQDSLSNEQ